MKHDPTTPARTDATLLVVDDNEDNRYILLQRLQREGYHNILQAADGVESMGDVSIRGKSAPVEIYRLVDTA